MPPFKIVSDFRPTGDQPEAIEALTRGLQQGMRAQTLLGVQVRLLALDRELSVSTGNLQKEIAITQRVVEHSVRTVTDLSDTLKEPHAR